MADERPPNSQLSDVNLTSPPAEDFLSDPQDSAEPSTPPRASSPDPVTPAGLSVMSPLSEVSLQTPVAAGPSSPQPPASPSRFDRSGSSLASPSPSPIGSTRTMATFYSMVDEQYLTDIELHAKQTAFNLSALVGHLKSQLQTLSSLSVQYMKLHKISVENATTEVSDSIVAMHALIAKSQQLNQELKKAETLHREIKQIKSLMDVLDPLVNAATAPTHQPVKRAAATAQGTDERKGEEKG